MLRVFRLVLVVVLSQCCVCPAQSALPWRYDLRPGDRLVYSYTFRRQVRSERAESVVEARFQSQVLIAGVREGIITAGFQRNRINAELVSYRISGKEKATEERPNFAKRMQARPSQFAEAMEFNTVGQPRESWEAARETPSHLLPALHEIEVLPINPPNSSDRWDAMNLMGMSFSWVGSEPIRGKTCERVKGTTPDGSVTISYWWSPESRVLEQVELEGNYPIAGGTSHEHAKMELESLHRNEPVSDWLAISETRLAGLEALLLSPGIPVMADQLAASLSRSSPASQRLALAIVRRRGMKLAIGVLNDLRASPDAEVSAIAGGLLAPVVEKQPPQDCLRSPPDKADPAKFGTLFRAALPEKNGPGVPYFLRIPLSYRGDRPAPLLVYLSGGPGLALDGVNTATDAVAATGYLVLYPQAGEYWWKPEVAQRFDTAMRDVFREFNVDRDRVYIAGFSNGGTGALYMAELWPQRFAAVVSLMGAGQCMEDVRSKLRNLANLPILFVHGADDGRISASCSQSTYDAIRDFHPPVGPQLRLLPGRDHDITLGSDDGLTLAYLKDKLRDTIPKRVNALVSDSAFPRQYWIEVVDKKSAVAEVSAEIKPDNTVAIRARDVTHLRLYLGPELFSQPGPVRVRWNGKQVFEGALGNVCAITGAPTTGDPKLDFADRKDLTIP